MPEKQIRYRYSSIDKYITPRELETPRFLFLGLFHPLVFPLLSLSHPFSNPQQLPRIAHNKALSRETHLLQLLRVGRRYFRPRHPDSRRI